MDCGIVGFYVARDVRNPLHIIPIIQILTILTAIHFEVLCEVANILTMHILVVGHLGLAQVRVAFDLIF